MTQHSDGLNKGNRMKVGDLVLKIKGMNSGSAGIVSRIYNKHNDGHHILEVVTAGEVVQWSQDWCVKIEKEIK